MLAAVALAALLVAGVQTAAIVANGDDAAAHHRHTPIAAVQTIKTVHN